MMLSSRLHREDLGHVRLHWASFALLVGRPHHHGHRADRASILNQNVDTVGLGGLESHGTSSSVSTKELVSPQFWPSMDLKS